MAGEKAKPKVIDAHKLASLLQNGVEGTLVIDSRSFVEYNTSHVLNSVNICCSKLVKRRLQQDKFSITELIQPSCKMKVDVEGKQEVVLYDQCTRDPGKLTSDSFTSVLLGKLEGCFHYVSLLAACPFSQQQRKKEGIQFCEPALPPAPSYGQIGPFLVNTVGEMKSQD